MGISSVMECLSEGCWRCCVGTFHCYAENVKVQGIIFQCFRPIIRQDHSHILESFAVTGCTDIMHSLLPFVNLLHDLWYVVDCCPVYSGSEIRADDLDHDTIFAIGMLSKLLGFDSAKRSRADITAVATAINSRHMKSLEYFVGAVAFIYSQGIRHKDFKCSQILLFRHGLWLTDFGFSNNRSELSQNATSGGDKGTAKH